MKTTEQLSLSEAKRLSIKKWQLHVDAGGYSESVENDKELQILANCGFCERWEYDCKKCEFGKIGGECSSINSLFNKWLLKHTKYRAGKILNVIKNLEE